MARPALASHPGGGDGRRAPRRHDRIGDGPGRGGGAWSQPPRRVPSVDLDDTFARRLSSAEGLRRLVVAFCSAVLLVAVAALYPDAFREANATARANASLDYLDRQLGGGNSILPDQAVAVEARGLIPESAAFAVSVGEPRPGWSELAVPAAIDTFMRYFLLPRRARDDARWVLCFACDRSAYPGAITAWDDGEGLAILRRPP